MPPSPTEIRWVRVAACLRHRCLLLNVPAFGVTLTCSCFTRLRRYWVMLGAHWLRDCFCACGGGTAQPRICPQYHARTTVSKATSPRMKALAGGQRLRTSGQGPQGSRGLPGAYRIHDVLCTHTYAPRRAHCVGKNAEARASPD